MTSPPPPPGGPNDEPAVDLAKHGSATDPAAQQPFDPYRFGRPDHPVPPEYAPPGYVPDPPKPASPYGAQPPNPYAQGQFGVDPYGNPYGGPPPGNPYGGPPPGNPYGAPPPPNQPYGAPPPGNPYGAPPPYGPPAGYRMPPPHQPYGSYPGYTQPQGNNGKAIAAMVLGIASIPFFFLTFFDLALIVPALVLGILGLNESRVRNGKGRSQAIAGLVCLVVGAIAATVFTVYVVHRDADCRYLRDAGDRSAYNACIRDGPS